jgi:RND family efflux transporter MFP subunit
MYVVMRGGPTHDISATDGQGGRDTNPAQGGAPAASPANAGASLQEPIITLSSDAVVRAGIVTAVVRPATGSGTIRIPAVVEPNAYRTVVVTPVAAGRVNRVGVQLGQPVRRGQTLAQIYSPELATTQSAYLARRAELDAHERELRRTEKLVEIGSASRQELEQVHAEHTAALAELDTIRSRLTLLGMSGADIDALSLAAPQNPIVSVRAPIDAVVTSREANVGMNLDTGHPLFTLVDLSEVWVVGNVYERDLARVQVGSAARVGTQAFPGLTFAGKISYIDPQVNAETRTAKVRVEVPNRQRQLRLGMYVEMQITDSAAPDRPAVPREAVQMIGGRAVVYLADSGVPGRFIEREVQLAGENGNDVTIANGIQTGDSVVVKGSFALRAERERLGLRPGAASNSAAPPASPAGIRVSVTETGFRPSIVSATAGVPLRLEFVRTTDATCATEVAFPALEITRTLPLNQPVNVEFTPAKTGTIEFACGMNMFRGSVVVH